MSIGYQLLVLFILAIPVACISWTVTHEEVFREAREWFQRQVKTRSSLWQRKFFYLFTCEYCFSHYVTIAVLALTQYHLLFGDWRGYLIAGFSLVWVANVYMSAFNRLRLEIKHENVEIAAVQQANGTETTAQPNAKPNTEHDAR